MNDEYSSDRKIVLGLGNTLNRDEGLGVHALKALQERSPQPLPRWNLWMEVFRTCNLLPLVEEASSLLVLDAINAHKEPGTLIELERDQIPLFTGIKLSDHQVTFQEVLGLASFRSKLPPRLHIIGLQPADLSIGVGLSQISQNMLPQILDRAEAVLREWSLID